MKNSLTILAIPILLITLVFLIINFPTKQSTTQEPNTLTDNTINAIDDKASTQPTQSERLQNIQQEQETLTELQQEQAESIQLPTTNEPVQTIEPTPLAESEPTLIPISITLSQEFTSPVTAYTIANQGNDLNTVLYTLTDLTLQEEDLENDFFYSTIRDYANNNLHTITTHEISDVTTSDSILYIDTKYYRHIKIYANIDNIPSTASILLSDNNGKLFVSALLSDNDNYTTNFETLTSLTYANNWKTKI